MGNATRLPSGLTRRDFDKTKSRAPGDVLASRQTILITRQTPSALTSTVPTPAQEQHPFWTRDERYIFYDSNRASSTDSSVATDGLFNIYRASADGSGLTLISLSAPNGNKIEPSVSSNGLQLAYVGGGTITPAASSDEPATTGFSLYLYNLGGSSAPVGLTTNNPSGFTFTDVRHPSWAPTSTEIVFAGKLTGASVYHIFKVNVQNGAITQLTNGTANDTAPAWSIDNNNIAFTSNATGFGGGASPSVATGVKSNTDIWAISINLAAPSPVRVTSFTEGGEQANNKNPIWSTIRSDPFGNVPSSLIAFASTRADTNPATPGVADDIRTTYDIYFLRYTGAAPVGNDAGIKLRTTTPGTGIDSSEPAAGFDTGFTSNENYPAWPQYITSYRIAYQSDRGGNLNIWASTLLDINAPELLLYNIVTREIVRTALASAPTIPRRQFSPGDRVQFRVRLADYETGVSGVYLQIKNPNSRQQSLDGQEHKTFFNTFTLIDGSEMMPTTANIFKEYDCQAINTGSGAYRGPESDGSPGHNLYQPGFQDRAAFSGGLRPPDPFWLPLTESSTEPGVFVGEWTTPGTPSDWYVDVIAYDRAINPFDPGEQSNWKIYDNVWGFTTETFAPSNPILYVNDYDCGQKFFNSRFGTGTTFGIPVGEFTGIPTESYMTEYDESLFPTTYFPPGANATPGSFFDIRNALNPTHDTKPYDHWRVLCRGPVPAQILSLYGGRIEMQPPDVGGSAERAVTVADRCVFWHTPYSGDLFVGNGTLTDSATQSQLTNFINSGGRLFLNGQDIAWALSNAGGAANAFLSQILKIQYVSDNAMTLYQRNIGGEANARINLVAAANRGDSPISTSTWYSTFAPFVQFHFFEFPAENANVQESPPSTKPIYIGEPAGNNPQRDWSAVNQYSVDEINFTATLATRVAGVDGTFAGSGRPAIMWQVITTGAARGKVVFSPFGWEAINPEFFAPPMTMNLLRVQNRRAQLMHNVNDFSRTGRVLGNVRSTDGAQPLAGVFVRIRKFGETFGTARTGADGSFVIAGVETYGIYSVEAIKTGYFSQTLTTLSSFHGGGETRLDVFLTPASPGSISGTITEVNSGSPVAGAIVNATEEVPSDPANPLTFSATSSSDGTYTLVNIPAGSYNLTVTPPSGFQSTSIPPNRPGVTVGSQQSVTGQDFQLKLLPGRILGRVTAKDANGSDTGVGISGATVVATAGTTTFSAVTDSNGDYVITGVDPNTYGVVASASGYATSASVSVVVNTNADTISINFALQPIPPGNISGLVATSNGQAVSGATIRVKNAAGVEIATGTTGADTTVSGYRSNYRIVGVPAGATVTVTAEKAGYNDNEPTDPVSALVTSAPPDVQNINFTLDPLFTFSRELSMVSAPYDYTTPLPTLLGIDAADVSGGKLTFVSWNGTSYVGYPTAPSDTFHRGVGYFLEVRNPSATLAVTAAGAPVDTTQPFEIELKPGWTMIGDPFPFSINFLALKVRDNGALTDVVSAQSGSNPSLGSAMWTYNTGAYQIAFTLDPWRGYWVRAFRAVTLIVDPIARQDRSAKAGTRAVNRGYLTGNAKNDGWKLELVARAGEVKSPQSVLGVSRAASNSYDQYKLEAPPAVGKQSVRLTFDHDDWAEKSGKYSVDVRSSANAAQSWEFTVTSDVKDTPVTLNWPSVATVPGKQDLILTDLETQVKVNLRSRSSYALPASDKPIAHRFRLEARRATRQALQLTDIAARVNLGASGRSPVSVGIAYTLTADATVQVSILQGGRTVRRVEQGRTRAAGTSEVTWDLKNDQGTLVAGNVYTVEVRAQNAEGRVVRRVTPLQVTR